MRPHDSGSAQPHERKGEMTNTPSEVKLQNPPSPGAVIFDMDGGLVNSNPFHVEKWAEFLREQGVPSHEADLPLQILGHGNHDCFRAFFGSDLPKKEMIEMEEMLEEQFRKAFGPHAKLLPGLMPLIEELREAGTVGAEIPLKRSVRFRFRLTPRA